MLYNYNQQYSKRYFKIAHTSTCNSALRSLPYYRIIYVIIKYATYTMP